jgi:isoleucyl-tRNA synthetase
MFEPVPSQVDFVHLEHDILSFWQQQRSFDRLRELRADGRTWSFVDGPITANNPMGVHHGWGRTYKDLFHRFRAMQGYRTRYQNGFDCQGLWVEVEVERERGFKSKRDIESFGLAEFVLLCKQRVLNYAAVQTEQSVRLGYWMDWDSPDKLRQLAARLGEDAGQSMTLPGKSGPLHGTVEQLVGQLGSLELGGSYFTFSDDNNYTIWAALKSCYDRGWIYKGRDVMPWCGRCGTGLSQHEIVTEGYQELTHPGLTLRFPLRDWPGEALLVWTTTPWTLTSNVAAAVGPELTYLRVRQDGQVLYLSKGSLRSLRGAYEVLGELQGSEMLGWAYVGPFDELPAQLAAGAPSAHRVIPWEGVGEEEGTGIVHIAPGAGAEDYQLGREFDLPVIAPLDESGVFLEGFDWLTGMQVRDAAQPIYQNLQEKGLAYRLEQYRHRYPVCWRCGEELIFRLVDEWFISMGSQLDKPYDQVTAEEREQNLRYQIMQVVLESTAWHPSFGLDRELDWLRNMHDWMISKKRYWGLALPIYECGHCGEFEVLGSREQLRQRAVLGWEEFEGHAPHRPYVDAVQIACRNCGERVRRIPDVGNPWLDAGVVALSTLGYNHDRAHWEQWFPADLISESFPGQFRNWFYSLLAMSTILERRAPFRNVFSYATLLAEDGRAMHKSWGNAIEFNEAADRMGVDVMRWLYCDHQPEKDLLFGYQRADEVRRQFLLPLWNVYSFFVTYANIDGWTPASGTKPAYSDLDRWLLARLQELTAEVTDRLESYEPDRATAQLSLFLDHLSNWYLRRSRRRFWKKAGASRASDADKEAAYRSLYQVLTTLIRLLAPFVPFVTEVIHQNLVRSHDRQAPESVHHTGWPVPDPAWQSPALTAEMALVMRLASLGHAARSQAGLKLRLPLSEAALAVPTVEERQSVERHAELLADELNVKRVRLVNALAEAASFELKPLPKQLGQRFGARYPDVRQAVLALEPELAATSLLAGDTIEVELEGERIALTPEEIEVRLQARPGYAAASEAGYLAALDTRLTPELELEGLAREFIRRAQELRKQQGLAVDDRIRMRFAASSRLAEAVHSHQEHIQAEILCTELTRAEAAELGDSPELLFDGESLRLSLGRA